MDENQLSLSSFAHSTTHPKYLHSNSTSHSWVFGAIAELIDNAVDAGADRLDINVDVGKQTKILFLDNGCGMNYDQLHRMLSFGHCSKADSNIGRYGNGFKSGSMRMGKDALVFTKQGNYFTLGLLSQTFLEAVSAKEVLVPMVSFDASSMKQSTSSRLPNNEGKMVENLDVILKYGPYKTAQEIMQLFTDCGLRKNKSGTCIVVYNLRKEEGGKLELDFKEEDDIKLRAPLQGADAKPKEFYSLKAYCSILYLKPKMAIYIRGKRVRTVRISTRLLNSKQYSYKPKFLEQAIPIVFGFVPNEDEKHHDGMMIYNKNRLIQRNIHVGPQTVHTHSVGKSVIGVVEADFLEPTHNKQDFVIASGVENKYQIFLVGLGDKLRKFWKDCNIDAQSGGVGIGKFFKALYKNAGSNNAVATPTKKRKRTASTSSTPATPTKKLQRLRKLSSSGKKQKGSDDESDEDVNSASDDEESSESEDEDEIKIGDYDDYNDEVSSTKKSKQPKKVTRKAGASGSSKKKEAVQCTRCWKWRMVPADLVKSLPDDWTCEDNPDKAHSKCSSTEETPEDSIPMAKSQKRGADGRTAEQKFKDLTEDIGISRDKFSRTDRKKERELKEQERIMKGKENEPSSYGAKVVGKRLRVYWRVHDNWFEGKVASYSQNKGTHKINYADGDEEELRLSDEEIEFHDSRIPPHHKYDPKLLPPSTTTPSRSSQKPTTTTSSTTTTTISSPPIQKPTVKTTTSSTQTDPVKNPPPLVTKVEKKEEEDVKVAPVQIDFEFLRASVKRFLQLTYPQNSKEADSKGNEIDNFFAEHIKKMEDEFSVDLNM